MNTTVMPTPTVCHSTFSSARLLPSVHFSRWRANFFQSLLCLTLCCPLSLMAQENLWLISSNFAAPSAGNGTSSFPSVSADGRIVAFASAASNIVPGDTNGLWDVFALDRVTGLMRNLSGGFLHPGAGLAYGSTLPQVSADGRFVVFLSTMTNAVPGLPLSAGARNLFRYDLETDTLDLVSYCVGNTNGLNVDASNFAVSDDGRYVTFATASGNVVSLADTNRLTDIFRRDLLNSTTDLVTVDATGSQAVGGGNLVYATPDARYVAFGTQATNVVPGLAKTNNAAGVYRRDLQSGATELVSCARDGTSPLAQDAFVRGISADGQFITFFTAATNVVTGLIDTNRDYDLFIRDMVHQTTWAASTDPTGRQTANVGSSNVDSVSLTGNAVAFFSRATNLVSGIIDTNGRSDLFVHWVPTRTNQIVSVSADGKRALATTGNLVLTAFSADGRFLLFDIADTTAFSRVPWPPPHDYLAVRDLAVGRTEAVALADIMGYAPTSFSRDGRWVAVACTATPVSDITDTNGTSDIYLAAVGAPQIRPLQRPFPPLTITADAFPGDTCRLQASSDLVTWTNVATGTAGIDRTVSVTETNPPPGPPRFYRFLSR
jgi:hypothetical protein